MTLPVGKMTASKAHLVDELEVAFQNCLSALTNQEHFNIGDQDETKTSVEQSILKFLDVARQLETFFLQKRLALSIQKPEQIVKEDIVELRQELLRKEALIQKHYEKLQQWQNMLKPQGQATTPQPQGMAVPQQQQPQPLPPQGLPQAVVAASQPQVVPQPQVPVTVTQQPPTTQPLPPPGQNLYPQGPLAYLEQTTSNIGLPERR